MLRPRRQWPEISPNWRFSRCFLRFYVLFALVCGTEICDNAALEQAAFPAEQLQAVNE
jgi:hypothetical protein